MNSVDGGGASASDPDAEIGELDYWSFVTLAKQRVGERLDIGDTDSSHLALSLNRASGILTHVTESIVHRPLKLNWSAFRMLFVLWVVGEIEQSKLTLLTNSSKATVSNVSTGLLKQELIERTQSEKDRRTFLLKLTDKGEQTVTEAYLQQNELLTQWSSVLDTSERQTLMNLLEKLMKRRDIFGYRSTT